MKYNICIKKIILIYLLLLMPNVFAWEAYLDKCIKSWIGYPVNDLIQQWGYPDEEKTIAGKKLYIWMEYDYTNSINAGGVTFSQVDKKGNETSLSFGGETIAEFCKKTIEVDDNNIVVGGQWKGNSCPLIYSNKKLMNRK